MRNFTKVLIGISSALTLLLQDPTIQSAVEGFLNSEVKSHPAASPVVVLIVTIVALIHNPKAPPTLK